MATKAVTMVAVAVAVMAAELLLCGVEGEPMLHRVGGGKYTWKTDINFTDWSIHEHFYVGDWLYFGYGKYTYNVLGVNKTNYESCIEKDCIFNRSWRGSVFNLSEARPYYFVSGRGFCSQGMKVAIFVENSPPTSPTAPHQQRLNWDEKQ